MRLVSGHLGGVASLSAQPFAQPVAAPGGSTGMLPSSRLLLTAGASDRSVRVWDTTTWDQVQCLAVIDARSSTHTCCCCCTQVVQINLGAPGGGGPQATCVSVAPPTQARLHSAAALGAMGAMDSGLHSAATWAAVGLSDGAVRLFRLDSLACVAKVPLVVQLCVCLCVTSFSLT